MHYIIYQITNKVNGNIYIGKHKCKRLDDRYFGSGKVLKYAIKKYGIENFVFEMQIDLKSQEEMDLLEQMVVNEEFLKRPDVYNISRGGKNPCLYGKNNPFFGKTHSAETKEIISKANSGKEMSEESKRLIGAAVKCRYRTHPEYRQKCRSLSGKKKCRSGETGEIHFYAEDAIPDGYSEYRVPPKDMHVPKEVKERHRLERKERAHNSRWFNDGKTETFCRPENAPAGFVLGRLPGLNVGRKFSDESKAKMSLAKIGKKSSNSGKIGITNGSVNAYAPASAPIPEGWRRGMTRNCKKASAAE